MASTPPPLPDRLRAEYRRLRVRDRLVLAVSGGADSMALFRATLAVSTELGLSPVVAHLDHGLRENSAEDAAWVIAQAAPHRVECIAERCDVRAVAAATGRGLEETARHLRYAFLREVAETHRCAFVATAHTGDDQAETVLFQLLRGSGLRGLRGIPRRRRLSETVTLFRPLLDVTRAEVEAYLTSIDQPYLTDASNADRSYTRNRLRHDLLPQLREAINPRLDESLRKLSQQASEVSEFLVRSARRELKHAAVELSPGLIRLRCDHLLRRQRVLIRETVALAWRRAGWPRQAMGFAHWDALANLVLAGGRRTLPGGTDARRRRGELILKREAG
jgi:tRNA(Ile)-lysidine synthase